MEKKYILTDETKDVYDYILHRIKAVKDFGDVKKGDLGGWIEKEENLSHEGSCWVYNEALVYEEARVFGKVKIYIPMHIGLNAHVSSQKDVRVIGPIGSRSDSTTFVRSKNNDILVFCGCFSGTIEYVRKMFSMQQGER